MIRIAIQMLVGDTARYLGIVVGVVFASFLLIQQLSLFTGILVQGYSGITTVDADIWVMDPELKYIDDSKPMIEAQLGRVRSVDGVAWAVPLYKGSQRVRLDDGKLETVVLYGIDDATLIGGPAVMTQGELGDLRRSDGVIVDELSASDKLAHVAPDGTRTPLRVGDTLELNDHRAVVVGLCKVQRGSESLPIVYTTYHRALAFAPPERKNLSFILAAPQAGKDAEAVSGNIRDATGLAAYTSEGFIRKTLLYFITETGIMIAFGTSVGIAFLIGTMIAGQTFYNFTIENLRHFGALKAMGATNRTLLRMVWMQAGVVGAVGFGIGTGIACLFGFAIRNTAVGFRLPWPILALTAFTVVVICLLASLLSIRKLMRVEPGIVFKG